MGNEYHKIKRLRTKFAAEHRRRTRSLEAHMNEAKRLIESDLVAGAVYHKLISTRFKNQEEALRGLDRRQEAREELEGLRTMVEERGSETWEQYCKVWDMEDQIHEAQPFASIGQIFGAMHDLAGIRVSLYSPYDVQKVVDLLRDRFEIVQGPKRKGGLTRDFQKIRQLVEEQREGEGATNEGEGGLRSLETTSPSPESPFGGYRATYVVIRNQHNFDRHDPRGDGKTNIEVQIGSIIMHAWSDIEHAILYKPSRTGSASPDVIRMLGLINGIMMTGEVALQQLASISAAESTRKAEDRTQRAMGPYYMKPWLNKYFMDRKVNLPSDLLWMSTSFLFDVLKATDDHHYGRLEELLNEMDPKPIDRLPVQVLHHIGKDTYPFQEKVPDAIDSIVVPAWSARYWATCLVNTLNLATYMDSRTSMFEDMMEHVKKDESLHGTYPTFAELLDVLHPTKIKHRPSHEGHMIKFCRAMLATTFGSESHDLAAMKLASAGYVARPRISEGEKLVLGSNVPPIFVTARLVHIKGDGLSALRIMPSTTDKDFRSKDKYLFFIPCLTDDGEYTCKWKLVVLRSGRWDIVRAPFNYDTPIRFETDDFDTRAEVDHMRRVLGVKMKAEDIGAIRSLAESLQMDQDVDQLRLIVKLTCILGTANKDRIQELKEVLGSEGVKGDDEKTMLAEVNLSKEIKDPNDLKQCLRLSRSVPTTDPKELSAYRQLERDHDTEDIGRLKKLRSEQKEAERVGSQEDSNIGLDDTDITSTSSDDMSATSTESSDNEN